MPDKWELATKKLFDLTEAGNLKWARQDDFVVRGDVQVQGFVYSATVNDKLIVVYEERVPGWEDEPDYHRSVIEFAEMVPDTEKFVTEWRWPGTRYDDRLLDSVRFHESGGEQFLNTFLASTAS